MSAPLTRIEALDKLAERLYRELEHIDPTGIAWIALGEQERDMYRHAIEFVFDASIELLTTAADRPLCNA